MGLVSEMDGQMEYCGWACSEKNTRLTATPFCLAVSCLANTPWRMAPGKEYE